MSKNLSISILMDFYSGLLTDKQKEALELYYNHDFSLAEIAENMDISRQGVRDFIKRGEKQLLEFEEGLGLVQRFANMNAELRTLYNGLTELKKMGLAKNADQLISELLQTVQRIENDL